MESSDESTNGDNSSPERPGVVRLYDLVQEGQIFKEIFDLSLYEDEVFNNEQRMEEIDIKQISEKLMDMMKRRVPLKGHINPLPIYKRLHYGLERLVNKKREILAKKVNEAVEEAANEIVGEIDHDALDDFLGLDKVPRKSRKPKSAPVRTDPTPGDDTIINQLTLTQTDSNQLPVQTQVPQPAEEVVFDNTVILDEQRGIVEGELSVNIEVAQAHSAAVAAGDSSAAIGPPNVAVSEIPNLQLPDGAPERSPRRRRRRRSRRRLPSVDRLSLLLENFDRTFQSLFMNQQDEMFVMRPAEESAVQPTIPNLTVPDIEPPLMMTDLEGAVGGFPMEDSNSAPVALNDETFTTTLDVLDLLMPQWKALNIPLSFEDLLPRELNSRKRRRYGFQLLMELYEMDVVHCFFNDEDELINILPGPRLFRDEDLPPEIRRFYEESA